MAVLGCRSLTGASNNNKNKFFLQDMKNLARKNCKIIFLQDLIKICIFLARRFLQDYPQVDS